MMVKKTITRYAMSIDNMNKGTGKIKSLNILIIYDSIFGNTKKVAQALQDGFKEIHANCQILHASEVDIKALDNTDLLVFGSPTRAFHPTPLLSSLIKNKTLVFAGKKVAVFDTRADISTIKSKFFRSFLNNMGYADACLRRKLAKRNAIVINETQGFYVTGSEGPLREGELERAFLWAQTLITNLSK